MPPAPYQRLPPMTRCRPPILSVEMAHVQKNVTTENYATYACPNTSSQITASYTFAALIQRQRRRDTAGA
jgi:hypothetical protein